jgi:hypothetical protein
MNVKVLGIRMADYQRLLASCDKNSPEYAYLIKAFISRNDGEEVVGIPFDYAGFDLILKLARSSCPEIGLTISMLDRWDSDLSSEAASLNHSLRLR